MTDRDGPLGVPAFRLFLLGRIVSLLGSAMAPVALAFAVLDHSAEVLDLGIVLAARSIPAVVFILVGGAVADRFSRRTVLLISNYGAAVTQAVAATVLISGSFDIVLIAALEFCNGTLAAFTSPALRGVVPQLLPEGLMQKANSLMSTSRSAIAVAAPTVAGLVVAGFGGGWALAFDAVTFLIAALCFGRLRLPRPIKAAGSVLGDIRDGWSAFASYTWVWVIVAAFAVMNFVQAGVWSTLGPAIAKQSIGETGWGAALSAKAAGLLVVSLILYKLRIRRILVAAQWAVALVALPMLGLGLQANIYPMMVAAFLAGVGSGVFGIMWETALQSHIPNHLLSRVSSYDDLGSFVAVPLGQLAVGPLVLLAGVTPVTLTGAAIYGALALLPLLVPAVRHLRAVEPAAATEKAAGEKAAGEQAAAGEQSRA